MIRTVYKGPTDFRGSRVIATNVTSGKRVTVPWDHALDAPENHQLAALQALPEGWRLFSRCSEKNGGYLFATRLKLPVTL